MSDRTRELECVISDLKQQVREAERARDELLEALKRCKFDSLNMTLDDLEFCRAAIARAAGEQL